MYTNFASLMTDSGLLIFMNGTQYTVANDHPNFDKITGAMKAGRYDELPDLIDVRSSVRKWISSNKAPHGFVLENDRIVLNGSPFNSEVTNKVLSMIEAGVPAEPLFAFLRKVRQNPSKTAQDELLMFCVANGFMIHEDGDVLAYKSVNRDYKDIRTNKFDNSVGQIVEMPRHEVDDNRDRTCSAGLHFAAYDYVAHSYTGAHIMIVKVNPRDVVSIPADYRDQKGRCCRYEVISEIGKDRKPLPKKEVYTARDLPAPLTITAALTPALDAIRTLADCGVKCPHCGNGQCMCAAEARLKLVKELDRKTKLYDKLGQERMDLLNRIDDLRSRGYRDDAMALDRIKRIMILRRQLTDEMTTLRSQLSI
ncbi:MAG: hypothetical protein KGI66_01370 [Patescibacteria group bacterium]|nr:hypothetical protein [Patescibacteria group bacterium]